MSPAIIIPGVAVARQARESLGVRFEHQGRSRAGLDCVGLIVVTYRALGYRIDDFTAYGRSNDPEEFEARLKANFDLLEGQPKIGCVLAFWLVDKQFPQHVAICCGETMIHAYADENFVREERWVGAQRWQKRLFGCYWMQPARLEAA